MAIWFSILRRHEPVLNRLWVCQIVVSLMVASIMIPGAILKVKSSRNMTYNGACALIFALWLCIGAFVWSRWIEFSKRHTLPALGAPFAYLRTFRGVVYFAAGATNIFIHFSRCTFPGTFSEVLSVSGVCPTTSVNSTLYTTAAFGNISAQYNGSAATLSPAPSNSSFGNVIRCLGLNDPSNIFKFVSAVTCFMLDVVGASFLEYKTSGLSNGNLEDGALHGREEETMTELAPRIGPSILEPR